MSSCSSLLTRVLLASAVVILLGNVSPARAVAGTPLDYLARLTAFRAHVRAALAISHDNRSFGFKLAEQFDGPGGLQLVSDLQELFLHDDQPVRVTLNRRQLREYEYFRWGLRAALDKGHLDNDKLMARLALNYGGPRSASMGTAFKLLFE